jgi:thioredoxin reductase
MDVYSIAAPEESSAAMRSQFETNVPGLFVAGGAIAGVDTGTIFIENGRFHGEKIIEVIARRE